MMNLQEFFTGSWRLERRIIHHLSGEITGKASGEVSFNNTERNGSLFYFEQGEIMYTPFDGKKFLFHRSFEYVIHENELSVYFKDGINNGQLYQQYRLDETGLRLRAAGQHECVLDHYTAEYAISNDNEFVLETVITGPHKAYTITTRYTRNDITAVRLEPEE